MRRQPLPHLVTVQVDGRLVQVFATVQGRSVRVEVLVDGKPVEPEALVAGHYGWET